MSLFRTRDAWTTNVNSEAGVSFIHVGNLLAENPFSCQIIYASYEGIIKIYFPDDVYCRPPAANVVDSEPLRLVHKCREPILSVLTGRFSSENPQRTFLAVLHPLKLSVYSIYIEKISVGCTEGFLDSWKMNILYDVSFPLAMFNMCCGILCEEHSYESIFVQSLGSVIHIYNGTTLVTSEKIPDTLFPGPLIFSNCHHSIITAASSGTISCYEVRDIIIHSTSCPEYKHDFREVPKTNPPCDFAVAVASWSFPVGEPVFQMDAIESHTEQPDSEAFIVAVCRNSIVLLSGAGKLLGVRRLQMTPILLCPIGLFHMHRRETGNHSVYLQPRFCVVTEEQYLLVFRGLQLAWSAKLPWNPVSITMPSTAYIGTGDELPVIGKNSVPGLIALLGPEGQLSLSYLGTSPPREMGFREVCESESGIKRSFVTEVVERQEKLLNAELEALKRRIQSLSEDKIDFPAHMGKGHNARSPVRIQAFVSLSQKTLDTNAHHSCSLDISVAFRMKSELSSSDPMFLNVHSCPPIVVVPNYLTLPAATQRWAEIGQTRVDSKNEFQHTCRLSVVVDSHHPLACLTPQDLGIHLVLAYSVTRTTSDSISSQQEFEECFVKLPLDFVLHGKPCEKADVAGLHQLKFTIPHTLDPLNWATVLPAFRLKGYTGSSFCLWLPTLYHTERNDTVRSGERRLYVTLNCSKRRLKLQSSSEDMLWPVLNEIYSSLASLSRSMPNFGEGPPLLLNTSRCKNETQRSFAFTPVLPESMSQLTSLIDCLFRKLYQHLDARIQIATTAVKNTIQSRHFRTVQTHIMGRIKESIPKRLNGFGLLLEESICKLIEGCDEATAASENQMLHGASVISLITLLSFVSGNCIVRSREGNRILEASRMLRPIHLLTAIESTELVEVDRGYTTTPEESQTNCDGDSPKAQFAGLEECLSTTISEILFRVGDENESRKERASQQLANHVIPNVNWTIDNFLTLCCKLAGCGSVRVHESQKIPEVYAAEASPQSDKHDQVTES
ncbi:Protein PTHB1 [Clonorchis sinensis]|uniref:Protein PTHB1 n=1 Tax=Clonorchis sinensis TaxID=79923 RepID=A0A419PY29_CLOSI|nr:Protein PTHB1 [Clonorchis sinensis]